MSICPRKLAWKLRRRRVPVASAQNSRLHTSPRMRLQLSQLHLPQIRSPRNPVCSISRSKLSRTLSISSTFACENTTRPIHRILEAKSHARDNMGDDSSFEPSMRSDLYTILAKVELLPLPLLLPSTGPLQFPSTGCASTCPSRARPTLCPVVDSVQNSTIGQLQRDGVPAFLYFEHTLVSFHDKKYVTVGLIFYSSFFWPRQKRKNKKYV